MKIFVATCILAFASLLFIHYYITHCDDAYYEVRYNNPSCII